MDRELTLIIHIYLAHLIICSIRFIMMYMCYPPTCSKFEKTWKGVNYLGPCRPDILKAW